MKQMKHPVYWILAATLVQFSCGKPTPPSDVARAYYMAANEGRYSDVEKLLSPEILDRLRAQQGGLKFACDTITKTGQIEKIEIIQERLKGNEAEVSLKILYKDGTARPVTLYLVKKWFTWKITVK